MTLIFQAECAGFVSVCVSLRNAHLRSVSLYLKRREFGVFRRFCLEQGQHDARFHLQILHILLPQKCGKELVAMGEIKFTWQPHLHSCAHF